MVRKCILASLLTIDDEPLTQKSLTNPTTLKHNCPNRQLHPKVKPKGCSITWTKAYLKACPEVLSEFCPKVRQNDRPKSRSHLARSRTQTVPSTIPRAICNRKNGFPSKPCVRVLSFDKQQRTKLYPGLCPEAYPNSRPKFLHRTQNQLYSFCKRLSI